MLREVDVDTHGNDASFPQADQPGSVDHDGPGVPLSTDLDDENAVPYFLWDDPMTVGEVHRRLATASPPERDRLLGKILREARDPDVWRFIRPDELAARFSALSRHLGRRRPFWEFLLDRWQKEGLLEQEPA
jgi:hypothetical protein